MGRGHGLELDAPTCARFFAVETPEHVRAPRNRAPVGLLIPANLGMLPLIALAVSSAGGFLDLFTNMAPTSEDPRSFLNRSATLNDNPKQQGEVANQNASTRRTMAPVRAVFPRG